MEPFNVSSEFIIHLYSVGVEFELGRIKKGFGGSKSGNNYIHSLNEVYDVGHSTVWHCGSNITCNNVRKRWSYVRLGKLLLPGSLTVQNITESLESGGV